MKSVTTFLSVIVSFGIGAQITFQQWYGATKGMEYAVSGCPVSAGGYVIAMNTDSAPFGQMDIALLRTDANGNETWRKYFGTSSWELGLGVIETGDGGFAICGAWRGLGSDSAFIIKTDANGDQQWSAVFLPSPGRAVAQDLVELSDGSIVVCGFTGQNSLPDGFLVKFTPTGTLAWQKIYGGASVDDFMSIQEVNGNGFILAGRTSSFSSSADFYVVRTDVNGDTLWTRALDTGVPEYGYDVACTQDGGFAIYGEEYMSGGDAVLIKINSAGAQQWIQTYDGGDWELGYSLVETWDGGFALAGRKENPSNNNHMWLIRTDVNGNFMWDRTYPSAYLSDAYEIHATSDGGFFIVGGDVNMSGDPGQAYVVKTENAGWVPVAEINSSHDFIFAQDVHTETITFTFGVAIVGRRIRITDAEGRLVCDEYVDENVFTMSTSMLSAGVYVYSVYSAKEWMRSGKFVRI